MATEITKDECLKDYKAVLEIKYPEAAKNKVLAAMLNLALQQYKDQKK